MGKHDLFPSFLSCSNTWSEPKDDVMGTLASQKHRQLACEWGRGQSCGAEPSTWGIWCYLQVEWQNWDKKEDTRQHQVWHPLQNCLLAVWGNTDQPVSIWKLPALVSFLCILTNAQKQRTSNCIYIPGESLSEYSRIMSNIIFSWWNKALSIFEKWFFYQRVRQFHLGSIPDCGWSWSKCCCGQPWSKKVNGRVDMLPNFKRSDTYPTDCFKVSFKHIAVKLAQVRRRLGFSFNGRR